MLQRSGYSGGNVGLASAGGGTTRNVEFRLTVAPDPKAVRVMRMFGEDIRREQAIIANAAIRSAKEALTEWEKTGRGQVKVFENVQNVGTAAATQIGQAWRATGTTIANALQQAQQLASVTPTGGAGGAPGAAAGGGGRSGSVIGRAGGLEQILAGGTQLARSFALSGLVGEKDSQKVLDTLLKTEGFIAGIHGVLVLGKGIDRASGGLLSDTLAGASGDLLSKGSVALGGRLAGTAGTATAGTAAAIAIPSAAVIAAITAAVVLAIGARQGQDIRSGKPTTIGPDDPFQRGSVFTRFNPLADVLGVPLDRSGDSRDSGSIWRDAGASADRGESQQRAAQQTLSINQQLAQIDEQIHSQQLAYFARVKGSYEERLKFAQQEREESLKTAQQRLKLSQDELSNAKEQLTLRQQEASELAGRFKSAQERFADLDPDERDRLARLTRLGQRAEGLDAAGRSAEAQGLRARITAEDRRLLQGVGLVSTENLASLSAVEQAERYGFSSLFGGDKSKADRAQALADAAKGEVGKAELTVRRINDLIIKLEKPSTEEQKWQGEITKAVNELVALERKNELSIKELQTQLRQSQEYRKNVAGGLKK